MNHTQARHATRLLYLVRIHPASSGFIEQKMEKAWSTSRCDPLSKKKKRKNNLDGNVPEIRAGEIVQEVKNLPYMLFQP